MPVDCIRHILDASRMLVLTGPIAGSNSVLGQNVGKYGSHEHQRQHGDEESASGTLAHPASDHFLNRTAFVLVVLVGSTDGGQRCTGRLLYYRLTHRSLVLNEAHL